MCYPKLADVHSDVRGDVSRRAVVAFDLMTMPLRLLPALPALTPALLCVFAEELDDDTAGTATATAITSMSRA